MHKIKTISPPPMCWTCGNILPESDFDMFHELVEYYMSPDTFLDKPLSQEAAQKCVLDGQLFLDNVSHDMVVPDYVGCLSKVYSKVCCRIMFLGDHIEYRRDAALYDLSKINDHVIFK